MGKNITYIKKMKRRRRYQKRLRERLKAARLAAQEKKNGEKKET